MNNRTIGQKLGELSNKIRRRLSSLSIPGNCSGAQERTLHYILANNNLDIFQKDIEVEFGLRPPTASGLLKSMEQNDLIQRVTVENDGRLKKIVPTLKALQYESIVRSDLDLYEMELTNGISKDQLQIFECVVEKMIENLS